MNTIILTGNINIGKSSSLYKEYSSFSDSIKKLFGGIICLPEFNDSKKFYIVNELSTENKYYLNPDLSVSNLKDSISIGPFLLSMRSLNRMNEAIKKDIDSDLLVVIDEFGKIELKENGLFPGIIYALKSNCDLIIIIRESILEQALNHIKKYRTDINIINIKDISSSLKAIYS